MAQLKQSSSARYWMSEFVRARRNHAANVRRQPHMRRLVTLRFLATRALITACMIVAGCSTPDATRSQGRVDWVQLSGFWQPHLLYLLDSPYPRLYVEVDAVEGCAPEDATLNKLRDFLATHCRKPEGIEIARSDVIPIKDARGVPSKALAHKFLNGPPENTGDSSPAFLYVLFLRWCPVRPNRCCPTQSAARAQAGALEGEECKSSCGSPPLSGDHFHEHALRSLGDQK